MKIKRPFCFFAFSAFCLSLAAVEPPQGAVVFRFDDNHSLAEWTALQQVFQKHEAPMNLAINTTAMVSKKAEFASFLQQVVRNGGEIMDHTPSHSCMKIVFTSAAEAKKYQGTPGIACIQGNTAYLKMQIRKDITYKPLVKINIRNGKIIPADAASGKRLFHGAFLEFPDGKIYGCRKTGKDFSICSIYETPCKVPDQENVTAILTSQWRLQATDDALRLVAKVSAGYFKELGLPAPTSFISPGGWAVFPDDQQLSRIYGKEFGYMMGDAYNARSGVYGRKDRELARFAMYPCWDSLERKTVEQSKRMIADMIAQHQVVSFISHFWYHGVPGGKTELLRRNDELLSWLRKKNIPILTMKQASSLLFDRPYPRYENLMPSLSTDLNEDGIPDGWHPGKNVSVSNGTLQRKGSGDLFRIQELTGLLPGKNTFRCRIKAPVGTTAIFSMLCRGRRKTQQLPIVKFTMTKTEEVCSFSFDVPEWLYGLQLDCKVISSGEVKFSEPMLSAK